MSLGFEQAGFDVVAAFDAESRHIDTYRRNFPGTTAHVADLCEASWADLRSLSKVGRRRIDVVFGGPPCQGFSLCGHRDEDDPRNELLFEFVRLVREIQPRYFVLENVDGLMLDHSSRARRSLLRRIRYAGYRLVTPVRILDAADFGVPQRRKRVFFLGYRSGQRVPDYPRARPFRDESGRRCDLTVADAISDLPAIGNLRSLVYSDTYIGPLGVPTRYAAVLRGEIQERSDRARSRCQANGGLSGCSKTVHSTETRRRFARTANGKREPTSRFHRLDLKALAPTLRAGTDIDHGKHTAARPIHPVEPRCITTREAARLHSFPDWFQFHSTRWHAFRQVGNSVPPRMARAVANSVMNVLQRAR